MAHGRSQRAARAAAARTRPGRRRRRPHYKPHDFEAEINELAGGPDLSRLAISEWKKPRELPRGLVRLVDKLGQGAFGVVYKVSATSVAECVNLQAVVDEGELKGSEGSFRLPIIAVRHCIDDLPGTESLIRLFA